MITTYSGSSAEESLDELELVPVAGAGAVAATQVAPGLTVVVTHRTSDRVPDTWLAALSDAGGEADVGVAVITVPYGPGLAAPTPAAALAAGMVSIASPLVAWIDGTGEHAADPRHLPGFLRLLDLYEADAVVGSKQHPDSDVGLCWRRRIGGRGYRMVLRVLFGTRLGDPRVGIKVFRRAVLDDVLPFCHEVGGTSDVEVLVQLHRLGYRRVIEAPVRVDRSAAPALGVRGALRLARDTVTLRRRLGR